MIRRVLLLTLIAATPLLAQVSYDRLIHSAQDTLFTSGTLTRFLNTIESVPEAQIKS